MNRAGITIYNYYQTYFNPKNIELDSKTALLIKITPIVNIIFARIKYYQFCTELTNTLERIKEKRLSIPEASNNGTPDTHNRLLTPKNSTKVKDLSKLENEAQSYVRVWKKFKQLKKYDASVRIISNLLWPIISIPSLGLKIYTQSSIDLFMLSTVLGLTNIFLTNVSSLQSKISKIEEKEWVRLRTTFPQDFPSPK